MIAAHEPSSLWERLQQTDPFPLVARLTLVTAVVNARDSLVELLLAVVAMAVLFLDERRMRSPWPWLALAGGLAIVQARTWWQPDDHVVATTYWVAALGLSRLATRPDDVRRLAARLLVAMIFTFAFGWKLLSSQYVSNDFFRYTLVWDERFEHVAQLGATDVDALGDARERLVEETFTPHPTGTVVLPEGERNAMLAWVFTVWGLVIEGAVALLHLLPLPRKLQVARPLSVMAFCATTYLVLPVAGFGFLLLTLAGAETRSGPVRAGAVVGCAALAAWALLFSLLVL